jgi:hypothetical protein
VTPEEIFNKAWDILVEHAGASKDPMWPPIFVNYFLEKRSNQEFRFGGTLGHGGKFWRNACLYYVTCYHEEETPKRREIIGRVNLLLAKFPYYEPET